MGLPGPRGPAGAAGSSVSIQGSVGTTAELPNDLTTANTGWGWLTTVSPAGHLHVWDGHDWSDMGPVQGPAGADGADGLNGEPGLPGEGVPAGGAAGSVLTKQSGDDFDAEWLPLPAPDGGGDGGGGGAGIEYENAWDIAVAYQAGDVVNFEGVEYLAVNDSLGQEPPPPTAAGGSSAGELLEAFPTEAPPDGTPFTFIDWTNGYQWQFRYYEDANQWICVGGVPCFATVRTADEEGLFAATEEFSDLPTPGPSYMPVVNGEYLVSFGAKSVGGAFTPDWGGYTDDDMVAYCETGGFGASVSRTVRWSLYAEQEVVVKYRPLGDIATFNERWLTVMPIWVAGPSG
jgi:hypothetical protein